MNFLLWLFWGKCCLNGSIISNIFKRTRLSIGVIDKRLVLILARRLKQTNKQQQQKQSKRDY